MISAKPDLVFRPHEKEEEILGLFSPTSRGLKKLIPNLSFSFSHYLKIIAGLPQPVPKFGGSGPACNCILRTNKLTSLYQDQRSIALYKN